MIEESFYLIQKESKLICLHEEHIPLNEEEKQSIISHPFCEQNNSTSSNHRLESAGQDAIGN